MNKIFFFIAFAIATQGCFTKKPEIVTNETVTHDAPMYTGHSILSAAEVPQPVRDAWEKQHQNISGEQWYKTDEGFIVYYPYKKLQSRISYDPNGKELSSSHEVKGEDVPAAIRDYMKAKYPGIQYGKTYFCYPKEGEKHYEVLVNDKWELFDVNGNNIGKNKIPQEK